MASAHHITLGGQLQYRVTDVTDPVTGEAMEAVDGTPVRALHIFDLDEQKHYEVHLSRNAAEALAAELAGHGILISRALPENGAHGPMAGG